MDSDGGQECRERDTHCVVLHKLYSSTLCGISVLPLLSLKEVDVDVDVLYRIIPQHGSSCEERQNGRMLMLMLMAYIQYTVFHNMDCHYA